MVKRIQYVLIPIMVMMLLCSCTTSSTNRFLEEKEKFPTSLFIQGPSPQDYAEEEPPDGVSEIVYPSGDMKLKAWVSKLPQDGKNHPAIVYAHGGFAFGKSDWEYVQPYMDAGFVVMTPMLRGENGNPGYFEFFCGEVDDVIAAGKYLAAQPGVDPKAVFLSGHSSGGTISMLVSMLPSDYKAIATFGASPDQEVFFERWALFAPFDVKKSSEINIRNPIRYIECIQKPLFVYVGTKDTAYFSVSEGFADRAKKSGKNCEFIPIEGDHTEMLNPSIEDSIKRFLQNK